MARQLSRRAVLAAMWGGVPLAAAATSAGDVFDRAAPLAGSAWRSVGRVPDTVESPHGPATVTYDDDHVPHVEAESEAAAYFAVGYVQAADRLAQMDLFRRRAGGTLAALVGEPAVENDRFAAKMDFRAAAEASLDAIAGTDTEGVLEAFSDGVNAYRESGSPGLVYGLLDAEPAPWRPIDVALLGTQLSWGLTGSFASLRTAVRREAFDAETLEILFPDRYDHGVPILRGAERGDGGGTEDAQVDAVSVDPELLAWLSQFEAHENAGSNAWVVSGEHTASGSPMLCNDPHLPLQAPPLWYQQSVTVDGLTTQGVALVGTPFVTIGETDHGAWGLTNVGADVLDVYDYETDGDRYRYRGEWRDFEAETRTIEVADGRDREVEVRKTVHGAYLDREVDGETRAVGVAWTGLTGTRELAAIHDWNRSTGVEEFRSGVAKLDVPTQNVHYAGADGHTLYHVSGKIPVRRVDGEVVRGDRVFDGSAGEAEWDGFEPYGQSTWDGFVPFEEKPNVRDLEYVANANQRPTDDPAYPIGGPFDAGFRATRIHERLEEAVASGTPIDAEFMRSLQTDTLSVRARMLVPAVLDARERMPSKADGWLDALAAWDYRMRAESQAALLFVHFYERFREATWREDFEAVGLDESYWPNQWVLMTLPPDSEFFDGDRAGTFATAMDRAIDDVEAGGWETYGDYNVTAFDHPLGQAVSGLNYERHATHGTAETVWAFDTDDAHGPSYRLVADTGGDSLDVIPGGNDGSPLSTHYEGQLERWATGKYRRLDAGATGDPDISVEEGCR